jgi:putative transposase
VAFIDARKDTFGVEPICTDLQVAPSTYYARRTRPPSARSVTDVATTAVIATVHADNYGVHGARKVHAEMLRLGRPVALSMPREN